MKLRILFYSALCLLVLGIYARAQTEGWARGAQRAPEPIDPGQLRSSNPGSWTYVYWYHGRYGK